MRIEVPLRSQNLPVRAALDPKTEKAIDHIRHLAGRLSFPTTHGGSAHRRKQIAIKDQIDDTSHRITRENPGADLNFLLNSKIGKGSGIVSRPEYERPSSADAEMAFPALIDGPFDPEILSAAANKDRAPSLADFPPGSGLPEDGPPEARLTPLVPWLPADADTGGGLSPRTQFQGSDRTVRAVSAFSDDDTAGSAPMSDSREPQFHDEPVLPPSRSDDGASPRTASDRTATASPTFTDGDSDWVLASGLPDGSTS